MQQQDLLRLEEAYKAASDNTAKLEALNELLSQFPLLFGYWLKFISLSKNQAEAWSLALRKCPVLDLWVQYLKTSFGKSLDAAQAAIDCLGYHFHSQPLWEALIARSDDRKAVIANAVNIPLYGYAQIFQLAFENEFAPTERLGELSAQIAAKVGEVWKFESQLKRPYFHPRELEPQELEVWSSYLDYGDKQHDAEATKQLYERCLITTALYSKFWIRYLKWLVRNDMMEEQPYLDALHYHPKVPELRALYASYLARQGKMGKADAQRKIAVSNSAGSTSNTLTNEDSSSHDAKKRSLIETAVITNSTSHIPTDELASVAPDLFNTPGISSLILLPLWKNGLCPDASKYAARLNSDGYLKEFFQVDSTLGYSL